MRHTLTILLTVLLGNIFSQEMQLPKLPSGPDGPGPFGAYYAHLKYSQEWDAPWRVADHPDVVVRFEDGGHKFVFWRGTSYIPCWVTDNGIWYTNEFVERRGWHSPNTEGCVEPMSDKQCRFSHVRIIESNDARVVVHWRYAPIDVHYEHPFIDENTDWADWVDEYYTIYPDATGVRSITLQSTNLKKWIEFHEGIVINQPGTVPDDNIEPGAVSVSNMKGEHHTYIWDENGAPDFDKNPAKANVYKVNLKSKRGPFALVKEPKVDGNLITPYLGHSRKSIFHWWDHWPVSQDALDGRGAKSSDNPSHSSLCHLDIPKQAPITCFAPIGDDSFIKNGALEWLISNDNEISMAFYKNTRLGDSLFISFDYADLWTSNLTMHVYDVSAHTLEVDLSSYANDFKLNDSEFNSFGKWIYIAEKDEYEAFGKVREIGITTVDIEEKKIIKMDNLKVASNHKDKEVNLDRFFDFNVADESSPEDIVMEDQPQWEPYFESENKITKLMLHGITAKNVEELVPMAKSWSDPAQLDIESGGYDNKGYDPEQMAYVLIAVDLEENNAMEFKLKGSAQSPVSNPAIVIKNWKGSKPDVWVNGVQAIAGEGYWYGIENSLEGNYLVLWNEIESNQPVQFKVSTSK